MTSLFSTIFATAALFLVHPVMPAILIFDYYLLMNFTRILNQTTFAVILENTKRHIYLNKLNFMGF